jgi:polysaccharide export outer membrane protein
MYSRKCENLLSNSVRLNSVKIVLLIILVSSCVSQRKIEYLQNKDHKVKEFTNNSFQDYTLKPNDELFIQITSLDDAAANVFSNTSNQSQANINPYGASLFSYTVDKDGFMELPVIGKIKVKDKTIAQVIAMLKESLINVLNQPVISVKLVNRYITILGEVRNPGHFVYSQEKLSIFDAIGMAGDIIDYGNRRCIILLRNDNGKIISHELNLTKSEILASEFYFLKPNDIIYVKPMRNKFWGLRQFPFAIVLSSITTAILVLNYTNK